MAAGSVSLAVDFAKHLYRPPLLAVRLFSVSSLFVSPDSSVPSLNLPKDSH